MLFKRLFTFGCSFTQYQWMTWADILACEARQALNLGACGSGNQQIFVKLVECHKQHRFCSDDMVMIMWTNICREDRWAWGDWISPGSIYNQDTYDAEWVQKFVDPVGCLKRDLAAISAARALLSHNSVPHVMMSVLPLAQHDMFSLNDTSPEEQLLLSLYADDLACILPSVYEVIFNGDWHSRQPRPTCAWNRPNTPDPHPSPLEHLEYINQVLPAYGISTATVDKVTQAQSALRMI